MQTAQPAMKMSLVSENKGLLLRNSCSSWNEALETSIVSANDLLIVTEVKPGLFLCRTLSQRAASFPPPLSPPKEQPY